jgi:uncharacterized RDD family membrane protein YckC
METNYIPSTEEQQPTELFGDINQIIQREDASTGQRFLNYLIDLLLMQYGLSYITGYALGYLLAILFPDFFRSLVSSGTEGGGLLLLSYMIMLLNFIIYYTFCEKVFKGYTLGKLITGTRAIREDGEELTFKDAILRSLSRMVPFEPFTGFGIPWHDSWTKTRVVKAR